MSKLYHLYPARQSPAHRARETFSLLEQKTTAFISPDLWSPNSPDLNPVDYRIWGKMEQCVHQTKLHDVDELKQRLIDVWHGLINGAKRHRQSN